MSASLFCKPQWFYSVRCHIYRVVSTVYEHKRFISAYRYIYFRLISTILHVSIVFILFVAASIFRVMSTVYKPPRFISVYCQSVFLSGACATTDVGRTSRREFTLVREVRTTAVSRRLRKTDWSFYSVFVQAHFESFNPNPP